MSDYPEEFMKIQSKNESQTSGKLQKTKHMQNEIQLFWSNGIILIKQASQVVPVSYTHLTLPTRSTV